MQYQAAEGHFDVPVILHHAVLGSLERMLGILLEVHGERLPEFLHPYPAVVVAVSEKSQAYAVQLRARLAREHGFVQLDESDEPLGGKLRRWRSLGVAATYVVGENEARSHAEDGHFGAMVNDVRGARQAVRLAP